MLQAPALWSPRSGQVAWRLMGPLKPEFTVTLRLAFRLTSRGPRCYNRDGLEQRVQ
jgi:hypothetical protein